MSLYNCFAFEGGDGEETNNGVLSGIEYLTTHTFATYGRNSGDISIFDKRQNNSKSLHIPAHEDCRTPCVFTKSKLGKLIPQANLIKFSDVFVCVCGGGGSQAVLFGPYLKKASHINLERRQFIEGPQ